MKLSLVKLKESDWEATVQGYIARVMALESPPEILAIPNCGFCEALILELGIFLGRSCRGIDECKRCSAYQECVPLHSLYQEYVESKHRGELEKQSILAILEWLYKYGKRKGWPSYVKTARARVCEMAC